MLAVSRVSPDGVRPGDQGDKGERNDPAEVVLSDSGQ
jgi:hypothetical protein